MNIPVYLGMTLLDISKTLMYEFWQDYVKMQSYVIWILTVLLFTLKPKIFTKILHMILKKDLIHQIMNFIGHYHEVWTRK